MEAPYTNVYSFERSWPRTEFDEWMARHWHYSFAYSAAYVVAIFSIQWYMEKRPRFNLSKPLALWSGVLAIFSIVGTIRSWPEMYYVVTEKGFHASVCNNSFMKHEVTALWIGLFTLSKVMELGDTIFIVLRKQPLILLHWYHHVTVLIYVWYSYVEFTAPGRWFAFMNYVVHSVMYSYYALRALKFRLPEWLKMFITLLQLTQMMIGCGLNVYVYTMKERSVPCHQSYANLYYSTAMYMSYFVLFAKFFYETYVAKSPATKTD